MTTKKSYTLAYKLRAVELAVQKGNRPAARELGVAESRIREWRQKLHEIQFQEETAASQNRMKRLRGGGCRPAHPDVEYELMNWIVDQRQQQNKVTRNAIALKAKLLSTSPDFKASRGWVENFIKRNFPMIQAMTATGPRLPTGEEDKPSRSPPLDGAEASPAESPGSGGGEIKTKKSYTLAYKVRAVELADALGNRPAARELGVDERRIREWRQSISQIQQESCSSRKRMKRLNGGGRRPAHPGVEYELVTWILEQTQRRQTVTRRSIAVQAKLLAAAPGFKASRAWVDSFLKRNRVAIQTLPVPEHQEPHGGSHFPPAEPNPTEPLGSDCNRGDQRTPQTPEMASVKAEDPSQPLALNVQVIKEEDEASDSHNAGTAVALKEDEDDEETGIWENWDLQRTARLPDTPDTSSDKTDDSTDFPNWEKGLEKHESVQQEKGVSPAEHADSSADSRIENPDWLNVPENHGAAQQDNERACLGAAAHSMLSHLAGLLDRDGFARPLVAMATAYERLRGDPTRLAAAMRTFGRRCGGCSAHRAARHRRRPASARRRRARRGGTTERYGSGTASERRTLHTTE